jgi:hypothetical protein
MVMVQLALKSGGTSFPVPRVILVTGPQNGKMKIFTRPAALARQSLICCRDFLLFIPASAPNLRAVLTYFNAATHINAEGDVEVSDLDRINT